MVPLTSGRPLTAFNAVLLLAPERTGVTESSVGVIGGCPAPALNAVLLLVPESTGVTESGVGVIGGRPASALNAVLLLAPKPARAAEPCWAVRVTGKNNAGHEAHPQQYKNANCNRNSLFFHFWLLVCS